MILLRKRKATLLALRSGRRRRNTSGTGARADHAERKQDVQDAYSANQTADGRMEEERDKRRKMAKEEILFPENGPGQIEEQRSHFEA